MITTLIFDIYGTIIRFEHGLSAEIVRNHMRKAGTETPKEEFHRLWGEYYKEAEMEEVFRTEQQLFLDRITWLYERYGCSGDPLEAYRETHEVTRKRVAYPEAEEALNSLRKKYRVVAGSNADNVPMQFNLTKNGIEFDAAYTSETLRCYKPRREFYEKILAAENIKPEQAVFIGDSLREDIIAPAELGMKTIWIDRTRSGKEQGQTYTVSDLCEIEKVL